MRVKALSGSPQVLTPSIKALRLMLDLNPFGYGRLATAALTHKVKTKKNP
ncbi:MAG: hypothetical protein MSA20_03165 [Bacteroidales bacterium]|nr:hypothetical protein [Bacteroidales bacterium]